MHDVAERERVANLVDESEALDALPTGGLSRNVGSRNLRIFDLNGLNRMYSRGGMRRPQRRQFGVPGHAIRRRSFAIATQRSSA